MTLKEAEYALAEASTLSDAKVIARGLIDLVRKMEQSFKVIQLECKIGLNDEGVPRGPAEWPGDW